MSIYEIGYNQNIAPYGLCHTTRYVKAKDEKEAKEIASKILHISKCEIEVIQKLEIINN